MKLIQSHSVPHNITPTRLSDYVVQIFSALPTKAGMRKAIKKGLVMVNGEIGVSGLYIRGGEQIELYEAERSSPLRDPNLSLNIIYEDEHLAVIFKPAGVLVSGNKHKTIDAALPFVLNMSHQKDALSRPRPAHRLDFPTSGLLLIGKTKRCLTALNMLFETKKIQKTYYAVCCGTMPQHGIIDTPIDEKKAETHFKVIQTELSEKHDCINLVELQPSTGRRHQLRIHLASLGFPIVGDSSYGTDETHFGSGLYLHAGVLNFVHPETKEPLCFIAKLQKKYHRMFGEINDPRL